MMVSAHWLKVSGSDGDFLGETALQPLGGKLDRRQRVLDLVRDAARDVGPGGLALRELQFGDVVEGDDEAVRPARVSSAPIRTSSVRGLLGGPMRTSSVRGRSGAARAAAISSANSGTTSPRSRPIAASRSTPEQLGGGAVGQLDPATRVEADHAGRNALQHRLGEPAAAVDLAVRLHQFGALRGELAGHAVERARQAGEFVAGLALLDAHAQIAAAHPFGGVDQGADRAGDLIGHDQADQRRREQHQQSDDGENPGEGDLQPGAVLVEPLILRHRLLGAGHVAEDFRIDRPADHQQQRRRGVQPHHRADPRAVAGVDHRHVAGQRLLRTSVGGGSTPKPTNNPAAARI